MYNAINLYRIFIPYIIMISKVYVYEFYYSNNAYWRLRRSTTTHLARHWEVVLSDCGGSLPHIIGGFRYCRECSMLHLIWDWFHTTLLLYLFTFIQIHKNLLNVLIFLNHEA